MNVRRFLVPGLAVRLAGCSSGDDKGDDDISLDITGPEGAAPGSGSGTGDGSAGGSGSDGSDDGGSGTDDGGSTGTTGVTVTGTTATTGCYTFVEAAAPPFGAVYVPVSTELFTYLVDPNGDEDLTVARPDGSMVEGRLAREEDGMVLRFVPESPLESGTRYTVSVEVCSEEWVTWDIETGVEAPPEP